MGDLIKIKEAKTPISIKSNNLKVVTLPNLSEILPQKNLPKPLNNALIAINVAPLFSSVAVSIFTFSAFNKSCNKGD